jgi:hypothetical protein
VSLAERSITDRKNAAKFERFSERGDDPSLSRSIWRRQEIRHQLGDGLQDCDPELTIQQQ